MKVRSVLILGITLLLGSVAVAQDSPKAEITRDYSYFRLNPGLPSVWNSQNLNGGGAQAAFYFKSWLALAADLQGYGSFTQCPKSSSEFIGCASGNLFTYTFGPQIKYRSGKFEPFAEVLLGGAHSNFYANACNKTPDSAEASLLPTMHLPWRLAAALTSRSRSISASGWWTRIMS
jgi:hypothetical protein